MDAFVRRENDRAYDRQTRFEAERVDMVLDTFRLVAQRNDLFAREHARSGERRLTFTAFAERFPTFPVRFVARYMTRTTHVSPARLFRLLDGGPLFRFFLNEREPRHGDAHGRPDAPADARPVGVVVPLDGYPGGFILHDADLDTGGVRWTGDFAPGPPHRVTFEPFGQFLRGLSRSGWTTKCAEEQARINAYTPPPEWPNSLDALPAVPAFKVLVWLIKVLRSAEARDRRFVCRLDAETRGMVGSDEEIGRVTGLSARQVRRALGELRSSGLVGPHRQWKGARATVVSAAGWAAVDALARAIRPDKTPAELPTVDPTVPRLPDDGAADQAPLPEEP